MKVRCFNIQWDTSDNGDETEPGDLPKEVTLDVEGDNFTDDPETGEPAGSEGLEDELSDLITEKTGFCHTGFAYEIL